MSHPFRFLTENDVLISDFTDMWHILSPWTWASLAMCRNDEILVICILLSAVTASLSSSNILLCTKHLWSSHHVRDQVSCPGLRKQNRQHRMLSRVAKFWGRSEEVGKNNSMTALHKSKKNVYYHNYFYCHVCSCRRWGWMWEDGKASLCLGWQ